MNTSDFYNTYLNYYWEESEIINGDRIEQLADYLFDIDNYIKGDHGRIKYLGDPNILIDKQIAEINERKPKIIFVYGHDTKLFLSNLDKIKNPFKLITHNSDLGIFKEYEPYINNPKIIKWFGQNNYVNHEKVITLPIAIARSKYEHGNTRLISQISKNVNKPNLIFKNFSIGTNHAERIKVDQITEKNGIKMLPTTDCATYWNNLARSIFCISPAGNGVDCHRIWESLYFKTIPIVLYNPALSQFSQLPILFIDNWEVVNYDFIINNLDYIKKLVDKHDMLRMSYWRELILKD